MAEQEKPGLSPIFIHPQHFGPGYGSVNPAGPFNIGESERSVTEGIPDQIEIVARALEVIGAPELLARWMQMPLPALDGSTPYSLLESREGRERVATILARIEHGIY